MFNSKANKLTPCQSAFLCPTNATHRQYEALRAFFIEGAKSAEAAKRFGYTPGSFRVLTHQFRQDPARQFFVPPDKGPKENWRAGRTSTEDRRHAQAEPFNL